MEMKVKIKRLHPSAMIPKYAIDGDACFDLTAVSRDYDEYGNLVYGTGLAFEIPEGYAGIIYPRSSSSRYDLRMANGTGIIDSKYRGEITLKYKLVTPIMAKINPIIFEIGERVAQMMIIPYPKIEFEEVDELSETERGCGGYGSTGK